MPNKTSLPCNKNTALQTLKNNPPHPDAAPLLLLARSERAQEKTVSAAAWLFLPSVWKLFSWP
jgi:hypothetical protein